MTDVTAERVAEVFVEVADTLVDGFDLVDFFQRLAERTCEVSASDAAGLLLLDADGRLRFMAASDERTHMLELFQVQADEGPCRDCIRTGLPFVEADLAAAGHRWPEFTERAADAGFRSVHAFPLRLRDRVVGALGVFDATPGEMPAPVARIVQAMADVATIALLQERAVRQGGILTEQLRGALNSRIIIEQAKGAIAQIYGVSVDDAFTLLRDHVRRHRLRLTDVAHTVVTDTAHAPDLTPPG